MARKNKMRILFAAALVVGLIAAGIAMMSRRNSAVAGIYLANGGVDCLVLKVENKTLIASKFTLYERNSSRHASDLRVSQNGNQLFIQWGTSKRPEIRQRIAELVTRNRWDAMDSAFSLRPSVVHGDWDLLGVGVTYNIRNMPEPPSGKWCPQFLHKVDDPRIARVFELLAEKGKSGEALKLADAVATEHPADEFVKVMLLHTELAAGDTARFSRDVARWGRELSASKNKLLAWRGIMAMQQEEGIRAAAQNRNVTRIADQILSASTDLQGWLRLYPEMNGCDCWIDLTQGLKQPAVKDETRLVTSAGVAAQWSTLLIMQGKIEDAETLACSIYRAGLMLQQMPGLLDKISGAAMCLRVGRPFLLISLNCCETEDDFLHWMQMLEKAAAVPRDDGDLLLYADLPNEVFRNAEADDGRPRLSGFRYTQKCAALDFQFARVAVAVRYYQLHHGTLPSQPGDLTFIPGGIPADPFTSGSLLRMIPGKDELVIYSVGPDGIDNKAMSEYDTNHASESGDMILRIPRQRQYAFPKGGIRASSFAEIQRQFPHGLPRDLFAENPGCELAVSPTKPVYIYSYGPDCDEPQPKLPGDPNQIASDDIENPTNAHDPMNGQDGCPEVMYDPTNGISSSGDLWIQLPPLDSK